MSIKTYKLEQTFDNYQRIITEAPKNFKSLCSVFEDSSPEMRVGVSSEFKKNYDKAKATAQSLFLKEVKDLYDSSRISVLVLKKYRKEIPKVKKALERFIEVTKIDDSNQQDPMIKASMLLDMMLIDIKHEIPKRLQFQEATQEAMIIHYEFYKELLKKPTLDKANEILNLIETYLSTYSNLVDKEVKEAFKVDVKSIQKSSELVRKHLGKLQSFELSLIKKVNPTQEGFEKYLKELNGYIETLEEALTKKPSKPTLLENLLDKAKQLLLEARMQRLELF